MGESVRCRGCWERGNNCGLCGHCVATRPAPPPLAMWMLCCNDSRGEFAGAVEAAAFDFDGSLVELDGADRGGQELSVRWCGDEERVSRAFGGQYRAAPHMLKVYGHGRLPVWKLRRNVGNLYWDQIGIPATHAVHLLRWLRLAGWSMNAGPTRLYSAFNDHDPAAEGADAWSARVAKALRVKEVAGG